MADDVTLQRLLAELSVPRAWPWPVARVDVVQTHVSAVFIAGERVLKLKKPLDLGFLDFSTRQRRLAACRTECAVNARLAPGTYLGVVAVVDRGDGLVIEAREPGADDEPAVLMRRMPHDRTLRAMLERGALGADDVRRVARRLAAFHDAADAGPEVREASRFASLERVVRGNLAECRAEAGSTVSEALLARLERSMGRALEQARDLVERRAADGLGRDGHGDLRLDHVYLMDAPPPGDVVVIDAIEFNDAFRRGDPVGDVAFLVMELRFEGRSDLADVLFEAWAEARGDRDGRLLLPLSVAHRHAVRGKVRGIEAREPEVPEEERAVAASRSRAHFLAALGSVAPPRERAALLLACGLPGSGKSTLARALSREGFARVSSDETRKALGGGVSGDALYSRDWTDRTYAACLREAETLLLRGERVVVDASFHEAARRAAFLRMAHELRVPALALECTADAEEARRRLARRTGDASDADASVRERMSSAWEAPSGTERDAWRVVPTDGGPEAAHAIAADALLRADLL